MKIQKALTEKSFGNICNKWASIINCRESGIQICYPITGMQFQIKQFLADKELQNKLFNNKKPLLLFIDLNETEILSFKDVEELILKELGTKKSLENYLKENRQKIGIFLRGFDIHLKNKNLNILRQLGMLMEKFSLSVILFTEINIFDSNLFQALTFKTLFIQNIIYQSLNTFEDSLQFFKYLEENLKYKYPKIKTEQVVKTVGGHYWLLKEAGRIIKSNPDFSINKILSESNLVNKGLTLFNLLDNNDQNTIINVLKNGKIKDVSEYLTKTKLITSDGKLGINYWYYIKNQILKTVDTKNLVKVDINHFDISLTRTERDAFAVLQNNKNIVTREMIAKAIWQNNWEEKYSDWAIDQTMHQIRKKITASKLPYKLITKKGEGFVLTSK